MTTCQQIHITFVITSLKHGGAEMMLLKLLTGINKQRFRLSVICLGDRSTMAQHIEDAGVPVYTLNMQPGKLSFQALKKLRSYIMLLKPDIIQGWMYHGNVIALLASGFLFKRAPVLWNIRGTSVDLRNEKLSTALVIKLSTMLSIFPKKIINNSYHSAFMHHTKLKYPYDRQIVIPNGFDAEQFSPSQQARTDLRRELGVQEDCFLIGLIARYDRMKDHAAFIQAACNLTKLYPDVHFVLAGAGISMENLELKQLINDLGIARSVHLLGRRDDIPEITAALDIATNSSWSENFANAIGEAMSCAVPCVVTDVGDSARIVADTGKVIPCKNSSALTQAWRELIDMGKDGRTALGEKARQRIVEHFSLSSVVSQYEHLFEQVIIQSKG